MGAVLRTALTRSFDSSAADWPWAVFSINVTGAFMLGYLITRLQERLPLSSYRRPLAGTGFCGAYTTFSTMQIELLDMVRAGRLGLAAGYVLASVTCGYLAVRAATAVARRIRIVR